MKYFLLTAACFFSTMAFAERKATPIILMQNFNHHQWEHVRVNLKKVDDLAIKLSKNTKLKAPNWIEILPPGLSIEESAEYILGLISIDFCHWGIKKTPTGICISDFYVENDQGEIVRGSTAMTVLAKRAYQRGIKLFDATFMQKVKPDDLRPHFMGFDSKGNPVEISFLEKRVQVMNEIGEILLKKWGGSFSQVLYTAEGRAFNKGKGLVELLVKDFPRYRDEYIYQGKKIGIYKLAQLSIIALQNALSSYPGFQPFKDCDALTLCADYQIPRSLHALGILEYDSELANMITQQKLIPAGSSFEIELRMATVFAGWLLKKSINNSLASEGKPLITSQELDYLLWSSGRQLNCDNSKHHLTLTTMY